MSREVLPRPAKRQYEAKVFSDKQLLDLTSRVVGRIRALQAQYKQDEEKAITGLMTANYDPKMPPDEMRKQAANRQQAFMQNEQQLRLNYEQAFRSSVIGDAAYCRRELLARVGGDSFLQPRERTKSIAIDGIMAGPDPIGDAADYLDALAKKLAP